MNVINHVGKFVNAFFNKSKSYSLGYALKFAFKRATGILKREREIDAIHYILNHCIDITQIPPAQGGLRKMQLCDAALLGILDAICKKHGWSCWLDGGTLLGAVRHKGFIPWDDDIDVCMLRSEFDELNKNIKEILATYKDDSLTAFILAGGYATSHLNYSMGRTGVFLDIFPVDIVKNESEDKAENKKLLIKKIENYQRFYCNHRNISYEALSEARSEILGTIKYPDIGGGVSNSAS